ncbi:MAG TPA: GNAT family N-acetyltransferase, partial [Candidatus Binatia bacterium]|nr:GNAT family N-acetyltransferase [Candidatus Binatia bacterium]
MTIVVKKYSSLDLEPTVAVLASAFVASPLHIAAFGHDRFDRNRLFFRTGLRHMFNGHAFVALTSDQIQGYIHFSRSPYCLPAPEEIPRTMGSLLKPLGEAKGRVIQWFARWCHGDPDEPHIHLGPLGVAPEMQRRGVGTALMSRYIERLQQEKITGYLETDRAENVSFYEKFGFVVT